MRCGKFGKCYSYKFQTNMRLFNTKGLEQDVSPELRVPLRNLLIQGISSKEKPLLQFNLENYWSNYQRTRNKVNIELRNTKKDYYSTKIAGGKSNPKEAWKTINSSLGRLELELSIWLAKLGPIFEK